jgi:capsular exopolysaccharide synthesis family protein
MELRDSLRILRKNWILIVAITLIGVLAAGVYSLLAPVKYTAQAKVFLNTSADSSIQDIVSGNTLAQNRVTTYVNLLSTPAVIAPALAALGLNDSPASVAKEVSASAPLNTTIIQISVVASTPKVSADLANAIASSLTNVVKDLETTGQTNSGSPVKLTVVQQATVPAKPSSPNIPLDLVLGLLIGLVIGIAVAVLRSVLDTRIHNEADVEEISDLPIIGGMRFDTEASAHPLIVSDDPRSTRAEAFRALRPHQHFIDADESARSFIITSSIGGEGKSTTSANLALALADAGMKVIVIAADLRRPRLDAYLGIEGAVGLTDLLVGNVDFDDVVQTWGQSSLDVLPAGNVPPNPSELLGSHRMEELIAKLEKAYDYVIFDGAPLLPVTDSAILATRVTGAILVVAAGRTHKNQLRAAIAALGTVGANVSGFVVTMLPVKGPDAYGYGKYGYGYSYYRYTDDGGETRKRKPAAAS